MGKLSNENHADFLRDLYSSTPIKQDLVSSKEHYHNHDHHDHDHDHDHGEVDLLVSFPCNVKEIKIKVVKTQSLSLSDHDQTVEIQEEEEDGFKTPTGAEHRIQADLPCPPAPRKRRWGEEDEEEGTLKRRRCLACRRPLLSGYAFDDDHHHDYDDHDVGKSMRVITGRIVSDEEFESLFARLVNRMGEIKKVNKANLNTLFPPR